MTFLSPVQQCQNTEGKISHFTDLFIASSPGVFQLWLWPLKAPGYLGGGLPCQCNPAMQIPIYLLSFTLHAVYRNRSCLCVCVFVVGGRAVSEPYYSQRARSACVALSVLFIWICIKRVHHHIVLYQRCDKPLSSSAEEEVVSDSASCWERSPFHCPTRKTCNTNRMTVHNELTRWFLYTTKLAIMTDEKAEKCSVVVWDRGLMTRPVSDQCRSWSWSWSCSFGLGLGLVHLVLVLVWTFWSCFQ